MNVRTSPRAILTALKIEVTKDESQYLKKDTEHRFADFTVDRLIGFTELLQATGSVRENSWKDTGRQPKGESGYYAKGSFAG